MNTYLKMEGELPTGIDYLNLDAAEIPSVLSNMGGITNAFIFNYDNRDVVGNAQIIGNVQKVEQGCLLGKSGYIDTGIKESNEFTWIVLIQSPGSNPPLVSSATKAPLSSTGFVLGNHLAGTSVILKMNDSANSTGAFSGAFVNQTQGEWVLIGFTRKAEAAEGTYKYHIACKPQGVALQTDSSGIGRATPNTDSTITIGAAPDSSYAPNIDTLFNFVSIHNKGMTAAELSATMSDLVTVFAKQGIIL